MIGPMLGAAAGAAGGGMLGQLTDTLSYPRRALWSLAGLPPGGSQALAQLFGMDPHSPWTQALGAGAEIATDPMTYLGAVAGGGLGFFGEQAAAAQGVEEAAVAGDIATQRAQLQAATQAMQDATAARQAENAAGMARFQGLTQQVDVPGQMAGASKEYMRFNPDIAGQVQDWGLGQVYPPQGLSLIHI